MLHTQVIIKEKEDQEPAWKDLNPENTSEGTLDGFSILEGGMESGKTSVALKIALPDGKFVLVQTSADIFRALAGSLEGAEQRFLGKKIRKN